TRDHDVAGNTTLVTRADAQGTVRWKQSFDYYWNGTRRKDIHPEPGKGYALSSRSWSGFAYGVYDEENDAVYSRADTLRRVQSVSFIAPQENEPNHSGLGLTTRVYGF